MDRSCLLYPGHILHTAHEKDFRKGNCVALKQHGTELYGTLYRNRLMFVAKQTSPDGLQTATHMRRLRGGFSTISVFGTFRVTQALLVNEPYVVCDSGPSLTD